MAFTLTYSGNGSTGGSVPVDSNSYNALDTVTVIFPTGMTRTGATFAYWNTKADGTGDFHGWPQDTSFPMPANDLTLYAQWFVATDLNNGGATTRYAISYDESLRASGLEPGRTQTLMAHADDDYIIMANWFKGVALGSSPINVYVTRLTGGAKNTGDIRIRPNTNDPNELRASLVSEITESFMDSQNKGWGFMPGFNNEESCGEALSLFLTQQFALIQGFPNPYAGFTANTANVWLNSSLPAADPASTRFENIEGSIFDFGSRSDYVNRVLPFAGNGPGTGCSMLFLYYLFRQLGFTIEQIIAAAPGYTKNPDGTLTLNATAPLQGVYKNLTGYADDPFPLFNRLLFEGYPEIQVSSIPGINPDNPWPLPRPSGLTGVVTGAEEGQPINAAVVVINGPASAGVHAEHLQLLTGPDGSYTTPPLASGTYTIEGAAVGYVPVTINVTVSGGSLPTQADIALPVSFLCTVRGTVTDRAGTPLSGVSVTLAGQPGPIWLQTTTGSAGTYSLNLEPGQYTGAYSLTATLAGYADGHGDLASIPNGATMSESFLLLALGTLTGAITDAGAASGGPIVGAQVIAGPASATSDATGRYTLQQLNPGPTTITVTADGFERAGPTKASVPEGATLTQDFALVPASATLTGTISNAENPSPISGALISVTGTTPRESSANGTYTITNIPAGLASITIKARGYDTIQVSMEFTAHETITQDFGLYVPKPPGPAR